MRASAGGVVCLLSVLLLACGAELTVTPVGGAPKVPPKPEHQCDVPMLRAVSPKTFKLLARLVFEENAGLWSARREKVEAEFAREACALGADAVLIEKERYAVYGGGTEVFAWAVVETQAELAAPSPPKPGDTSFGTCFAISPDGLVLTAEHVVRGAKRISVQFEGKTAVPASVLGSNDETDIALLKIEAPTAQHLPLATPGAIAPGDRVFTLGYPVVEFLGHEPKFTEGSVSALSGPRGERSVFQIGVPVQPGNSGGPVVTESGEVVGIVTSSASALPFLRATGSLPQSINWAVKIDLAAQFLAGRTIAPAVRARDRGEAIRFTRSSVCAITAEL